MRFRGKSIRRKMVALLLVPLLSLVSIWAFATAITAREACRLLAVSAASDTLGVPAENAVHAVQAERRQTLVYLADPRRSDALTELRETQAGTDAAVARVRDNASGAAIDDLRGGARGSLDALLQSLEGLDRLRHQVQSNTVSRAGALEAYNEITDPAYRFLSALHLVEDIALDRQGRAVVGIGQAREYLAREDALVAGALAAGRVTDKEIRSLSDRVTERELVYTAHLPDLPAADRHGHDTFWRSGPGRELIATEENLLDAGEPGFIQPDQWEQTTTAALEQLRGLGIAASERYQDRVDPAATAVLLRAGAAGVVGFLAVLLSVIVSLRIGRGLIRDLRALGTQAKDAAEVRLPEVMRRLAAGERVDVETEAPQLEFGRDEAGRVGHALNTLQRAAVRAAVEQADLRRGVSDVFVNLARRNQVLLHRQLSLLDTMERRTEDADELADLFRLDHLTTRMRRHAEGLVILSGAAPARQWRKPVQLMDVVRAAVAEVEDYERVEVRRLPGLAVAGGAVADLTHLVAELLENAAVFSPPHTAVQVCGERVPSGFTLEIHDRGLGMTAEAQREANERLGQTPDFELSDTDRLGLFVVARLAERHGVRVALRDSPYGGTTAVVLLPGELLTETPSDQDGGISLSARPEPHGLLNGPVDGPVELEAPVGAACPALNTEPRAETTQHPASREDTTPAPLPRRTPVLVADHGRPVGPEVRAEPFSSQEPGPEEGKPVKERPTTVAGLPRRVRGAGQGPKRPPVNGSGLGPSGTPWDDEPAERDADEVRVRLAALQKGWQRGRQHTDSGPGENRAGITAEERDE